MKSVITIFLSLSFVIINYNHSLAIDTKDCDNFALTIPPAYTDSPLQLSAYIYSNGYDGEEYVRVAYTWICTNISYTLNKVDSLKHLNLVEYTFATRSGKCTNFSATLTALCELAGIEAYSVLGYVKIDDKIITNKDHAWNVINIEDNYYLFDSAFDSQILTEQPNQTDFIYQYYKEPGDEFIHTHMPYDPVMQLLSNPLTHKEYVKGKSKGINQLDFRKAIESYRILSENDRLTVMYKRAVQYDLKHGKLKFLHKRLKVFVQQNTI